MALRAAVFGAGAALALAGCAPATTGTVAIDVRALPVHSQGRTAEVIVRQNGADVANRQLAEGEKSAERRIPFGNVEVEVVNFCTLSGELTAEAPLLELAIDAENCSFIDSRVDAE